MLGHLTTWLRILGFDASYFPEAYSRKISYISIKENRIILTRSKRVSKKRSFQVLSIDSDNLADQLIQVIHMFDLTIQKSKLFSRCSYCNVHVTKINKHDILGKVPSFVYKTSKTFSTCPSCRRIYWQGTHDQLLLEQLKKMHISFTNQTPI